MRVNPKKLHALLRQATFVFDHRLKLMSDKPPSSAYILSAVTVGAVGIVTAASLHSFDEVERAHACTQTQARTLQEQLPPRVAQKDS